MTVVYPASKAKHAPWWRALRAAGVPISPDCHWIDWSANEPGAPEASAEDWCGHWQGCIHGAANADVLLFLDMPGENQCGAIAELGAALAAGKQVFLVSENWWSIEHHPRCRKFRRLEDAVAALMAMQAGSRARERSRSTLGHDERSSHDR
jgi:hypothetical protein